MIAAIDREQENTISMEIFFYLSYAAKLMKIPYWYSKSQTKENVSLVLETVLLKYIVNFSIFI